MKLVCREIGDRIEDDQVCNHIHKIVTYNVRSKLLNKLENIIYDRVSTYILGRVNAQAFEDLFTTEKEQI